MTTTYMSMHRYNKDTDLSSSNVFRNEDKAKAKNMFASRSLQHNLDRERGIEKMHMETIRREQMMLQKELQKVRTKGQYMDSNRAIVRPPNRLRHINYRYERHNRPKVTESGAQPSDQATRLDSFPSINITSKQIAAKSTPLQREYEQKMQLHQKECNREQTISQRRLNKMSRKQEKLVARVADLTEGLKHATTSGKDDSYTSGIYNGGKQLERKMSHHEKVSSNLKTLPSIFSLPIPNKVPLSDSPQTPRRLEVSPLASDVAPSPMGNSLSNGSEAHENTRTTTSSEENTASKARIVSEDSKRIADIIANPTLWFDQDKYAPDGGLRTIHLLPDSDDSFHEAKKARYLRWKDPQTLDKELSVTEVFSQTKKKDRRH